MEQKPKPIFEKRIFWDINFENIDYDAKANFVIERVFDRGDVQDIRNCRRYRIKFQNFLYDDKKFSI